MSQTNNVSLPDLGFIGRQELRFNRSLNARDWPDMETCRPEPGGEWGVIRFLNGQATTQPLSWSAEKPWMPLERRSLPNRCLVPFLNEDEGGQLAMAAGLLSLNNTVEASAFHLFHVGSDDKASPRPFIVPSAHWQHWIEPSADVRDFIPTTPRAGARIASPPPR